MEKRLKVLISAYACEPNKGSEPEVGWQWALQMARFHEVTVLTRTNNRKVIEKELERLRGSSALPEFVYHDEGPFLLWLKQHFKVIRLYYIFWQISAWKIISRLRRERGFDLLHHLTFAGFRYRAAIWNHGVPNIWGPVGGIHSIPWRLLPWKYPRSLMLELFRHFNNFIQSAPFHMLPKRAQLTTITLVSTEEMEKTFLNLGLEVTLMPTIGLHYSPRPALPPKDAREPLRILFAGNLITLKGIDLAIQAVKESGLNASFTIIGDGGFGSTARKMVKELGLEEQVFFCGRLTRSEMLEAYSGYDLFLFPSLHDTGSYAIIEAMSCGLPVICLDYGGPRLSVREGTGIRVPLGSQREVIQGLAEALRHYDRNRELLAKNGAAAREVIARDYDWNVKGRRLSAIYQKAVAEWAETRPEENRISRSGFINFFRRLFPIKSLGVSAFILLAIGTVGFLSINHLKKNAEVIALGTLPGLSDAGAANSTLAEGFNRALLMVTAETPKEREGYHKELDEFGRQTDEALKIYSHSISNPNELALFNEVLKRRLNYRTIRQRMSDLANHGQQNEAIAVCKNSLLPAYLEYKTAAEKLLEYDTNRSMARGEKILEMCTATQYAVAAVGIILFVVGFVIGLLK
jgi:glycosyltransferase involved in cell wall biosynthesis